MYELADLFDMRSAVGAKIELILTERDFSKAGFCTKSGISRPTLDKILSANITNKINYEKHITKVLNTLEMTPDMLMGNTKNRYSQFRALRELLHIDENNFADFSGISAARLKEIEAGAETELSELRDFAFALHTSVRCVLGKNYFQPQIAIPEYFLTDYSEGAKDEKLGFWGHVGILPAESNEYHWYPITGNTRSMIYDSIDNNRMVIPCMNNKVLWINMENIQKLVLLDEACDQPEFGNWDPTVDCGDIPLVLYEAVIEYKHYKEFGEELPTTIISQNLRTYVERFVEDKECMEEIINSENEITIYYPNGKIDRNDIEFDGYESISEEISLIYEFGESAFDKRFLFYHDYNGAEIFLNIYEIAVIELPLLKLEDAICAAQEEILEDY